MLGSIIQSNRQVKGLSLGTLAERAGINKSTLSRWETGKSRPYVHELIRVLDILEVPQETQVLCLQQIGAPRSERHIAQLSAPISSLIDSPQQTKLPISGGELLRTLRTRQGFTQQETAQAVGVTQSLLSQWESNECWPDRKRLHTLCHTLQATIEEERGLQEHAWKYQEEMPMDKEALDLYLKELNGNDTLVGFDLMYLAVASRYQKLYRNHEIGELDTLPVWGVYGNTLVADIPRRQDGLRLARIAFEQIRQTSGYFSWAQMQTLLAITNMLTHQHRNVERVNTLLEYEARIPPNLYSRWCNSVGMGYWMAGWIEVNKIHSYSEDCIQGADRYFQRSIASASNETDLWTTQQRYAWVLCQQGRFTEALEQLQTSPKPISKTRVYHAVEREVMSTWAYAGVGDTSKSQHHLDNTNALLDAHPYFLERDEMREWRDKIIPLLHTS